MADRLLLAPRHRRTLEALLREHLPDVEVWAYGSRVNGRGHEGSDLDLVLRGPGLREIPIGRLIDFEDAVRESNIPFLVEARDWARLPERFRREIERGYVVAVGGCTGSAPRWPRTPLGRLVSVHRDQVTPSSFPDRLFAHHSIPAYDDGQSPVVESGSAIKSNKFTVPSDAILVSRLNPRFARVWVPEVCDDLPAICSTEFLVLRPSPMDRRFLHQLCLSPGFRTSLLERVTGTSGSHQRVPPDSVLEIDVAVPPLPEQRAIAHILGTLDDKIELNRRMNETLEAMARALFKSWFVDFDPVRARMEGRDTGLPPEIADLFPDRMVDSELGEIPEGWEVARLGTVIVLHDRRRIPLNKRQRADRQGSYPYYGAAGIMDYVDGYLFDGVHILTGEDGSVVDAHGHPVVQYVWGKFWVNNHAHVIKGTRGISDEHLYLQLRSINISAFVTGAVQPKLNQKNLKAIPLVVPADSTSKAFSFLVAPLFAELRHRADQSRTLANLRDTLLPKLISGEIRVPPEAQTGTPATALHDGSTSSSHGGSTDFAKGQAR